MSSGYGVTDFVFIPLVRKLRPRQVRVARAPAATSRARSWKARHVEAASLPTTRRDRRCSLSVHKQLWTNSDSETTDRRAGLRSDGRRRSSDLGQARAALEAPPEMASPHRAQSPCPTVPCPRSLCKKHVSRRLHVNLAQKGPWRLRRSDCSFG